MLKLHVKLPMEQMYAIGLDTRVLLISHSSKLD